MIQTRSCLTCSQSFEVPASSHRKYCSIACRPVQGRPRKARPPVEVQCGHCGESFQRTAWVAEKQSALGRAQYCSTTCRDDAKRGRRGEHRVARVSIECQGCGSMFDVLPHEAHRRKVCSHRCAGRIGGRRGDEETRFLDGDGYVNVYLPPARRPAGQEKKSHQKEHRVVMAQMLGRWPESHESVHHINGDKTDNRPENLQLRNGRHGKGGVLRCRSCGSSDIEHVELD